MSLPPSRYLALFSVRSRCARSQRYNKELKTLLDNRRDDASPVAEIGEHKPTNGGGGGDDGGKKKRLPLEEITRFTMVKRIW